MKASAKDAEIHLAIQSRNHAAHLCKPRLANVAFKIAQWVEETRFKWRHTSLGDVEFEILVDAQ